MSNKSLKIKLPLINEPIIKKNSAFVGGRSSIPRKIVTKNDAYKRQ